ncbi:MAG: DUF4157 domain-containing protein [Chitinophagaceae bacterium]
MKSFGQESKTEDGTFRNKPLQRKCACGRPSSSGTMCDECSKADASKENGAHIQRSPNGKTTQSVVEEALNSSGSALDNETKVAMESRFSNDFSNVKIHTGQKAADSAERVDARAFTVGEHIVFGRGNYNPATAEGKRLLAHELTHVSQQRSSPALQLAGNSERELGGEEKVMEEEAVAMESEIEQGKETEEGGYVDEPGLEGDLPNPTEEELAALLDVEEEEDIVLAGEQDTAEASDSFDLPDPTLLQKAPAGKAKAKAAPKQPQRKIVIDLGKQTATALEDGKAVKTMPVSSGKKGHETTPGSYKIYERDKEHKSSTYGKCVSAKGSHDSDKGSAGCKKGEKYEGAPMKYFQRFNGAEGLHKGVLPGTPASHGCVRLAESNAKWLWEWAKEGTPVQVVAPKPKVKPAAKAKPGKAKPPKAKPQPSKAKSKPGNS